MHILLRTRVKGKPISVFERFDDRLLLALKPPLMRIILKRFDGQKKDDLIHVTVKVLGIFRQEWENVVSENFISPERCFFVDEGLRMPAGMTLWRHRHIVEADGEHSCIVDDIEFVMGNKLMDWLLYPGIWFTFRYRKPIYKRFFGRQPGGS
jgi:ligand-binding SRPBCC domain-containing protein